MKDIIYDFVRALINLAKMRKVCRHAGSIVLYRWKYLGHEVLVKAFLYIDMLCLYLNSE